MWIAPLIDASVNDVEGVAESLVESCPGDGVQPADGTWIESDLSNCDDVVTIDDGLLGQAMLGSDGHLGGNPPYGSRYRGAGNSVEHGDHGVAG